MWSSHAMAMVALIFLWTLPVTKYDWKIRNYNLVHYHIHVLSQSQLQSNITHDKKMCKTQNRRH